MYSSDYGIKKQKNNEGQDINKETECCPICNMEVEDLDHLFVSCSLSLELWAHFPNLKLDLPRLHKPSRFRRGHPRGMRSMGAGNLWASRRLYQPRSRAFGDLDMNCMLMIKNQILRWRLLSSMKDLQKIPNTLGEGNQVAECFAKMVIKQETWLVTLMTLPRSRF
ncbi:hypothetical protein RHMOL_Rhmol13G0121100 [Rhododendron molle]|uniref:Uncharacterized protein n=1 Tax=Rhododendron molle TaxID=49168 RepID=A0ACC0L753_RHOML|nr:hypothetical protein RHMOL_Rhmol13G0121100 [Rhododendron molle]